jgi:hypothetical protein
LADRGKLNTLGPKLLVSGVSFRRTQCLLIPNNQKIPSPTG